MSATFRGLISLDPSLLPGLREGDDITLPRLQRHSDQVRRLLRLGTIRALVFAAMVAASRTALQVRGPGTIVNAEDAHALLQLVRNAGVSLHVCAPARRGYGASSRS